jgi:NTE family protein
VALVSSKATPTALSYAQAVSPPLSRRSLLPHTVLLIAAAGVFMEFVDSTIVNVAFADIKRSFPTASISQLSWVFNAYTIMFGAFLVGAGRLADLLGRKRLFLIGIVIFTSGSALCAVAPSIQFLIVARALQAIGGAVVVPASLALIVHAFPPEQRGGAIANWGAAAAAAAALGPPLGGLLIKVGSWRLAFLVNVPIGTVVLIIAARVLIESRSPGRREFPDLLGAAILAIGIGALTLGIVQGSNWGWANIRTLAAFATGAIVGVLFVRRSRWHRSPVLDPALIHDRGFRLANVAILVAGMGFYSYLLCHVLFLIVVWHYSALEAGAALVPAAVIAAIVAGAAGRLADRHGFRVLVVPGALVYAAAFAYFRWHVGNHPAFVSQWLLGGVITGIGAGLTMPQLGGHGLASASGTRFATAASMNSAARQIGGALGIAILVVILSDHPGPSNLRDGWLFAGGCFVVVSALALGFRGAPHGEVALAEPGERTQTRPPSPPPELPTAAPPAALPEPSDRLSLLRGVRVLAGMPAPILEELARVTTTVRLGAGTWLFRQGDRSDALYVISTGRIEVVGERPARGRMAVLGHGEVLGDLGVLADNPRSASARALRDSELLRIDRDPFLALLATAPEAGLAITRALAGSLQGHVATQELRRGTRPGTVALVSASPDAQLAETAVRLQASMTGAGALACPSGLRAGELQTHAAGLLDHAEREHGQVLLIVESRDPPEWVDFCARQSDHVIGLGAGEQAPGLGLGGVGSLLADRRVGEWDLLLPTGAVLDPWHEFPTPGRIRRLDDDSGGLESLGRVLAGHGVGLVLSGGGARALAHVGAVAELEAGGVRFDRLGGTGTGALVAAMLATGMSASEIDAICYEELVRRKPFGDYTVPRASLLRGHRLRGMLERIFGDLQIEELRRDFFCVSADLLSGERIVHRDGSVVETLLGTLAMPGLMPPQARDSHLLVEGTILDNLPVDVMQAAAPGPVVAVDASGRSHGLNLIERSRRTRSAKPDVALPSITETLARTMTLSSVERSQAALAGAELAIVPDTSAVGALEFHQIDSLLEAGRTAAREALSRSSGWPGRNGN